jgi:hypothetical protein
LRARRSSTAAVRASSSVRDAQRVCAEDDLGLEAAEPHRLAGTDSLRHDDVLPDEADTALGALGRPALEVERLGLDLAFGASSHERVPS